MGHSNVRLKVESLGLFKTISIFDSIYFEVNEAEHLIIVGPNGVGKSSLLKVIAGLEKASRGQIQIVGRAELISPEPELALHPEFSVLEAVFEPIELTQAKKTTLDEIKQLLEKLDLKAGQKIRLLSGGEKRRVLWARALALKPDILLFDEPWGGLGEKYILILTEILAKTLPKVTGVWTFPEMPKAMPLVENVNQVHICNWSSLHRLSG